MRHGEFCSHMGSDGRWEIRTYANVPITNPPNTQACVDYHDGWNAAALRHTVTTPIPANASEDFKQGAEDAVAIDEVEWEMDVADEYPWQVMAWVSGANAFTDRKENKYIEYQRLVMSKGEDVCTWEAYEKCWREGWEDAAWLAVQGEYRDGPKSDYDKWAAELVAAYFFCTEFNRQLRFVAIDRDPSVWSFKLTVPMAAYEKGRSNFQFHSNNLWTLEEDFEEHVLDLVYQCCLKEIIPMTTVMESGPEGQPMLSLYAKFPQLLKDGSLLADDYMDGSSLADDYMDGWQPRNDRMYYKPATLSM